MNGEKCYFDKAQYLLGEPIRIQLPVNAELLTVQFFSLEEPVELPFQHENGHLVISDVPAGEYGITVKTQYGIWEGAFDVVPARSQIIRYGFLSDFSPLDVDDDDVCWLKDLHINAVQFYDWMYRHDNLLPPKDNYEDPMGRPTSMASLSKKINSCKAFGMRPFAYGAVYAATEKTFLAHPQWGMYTLAGSPMVFANWLYFMDISQDCGWREHILHEYRHAIKLGFSGIHMDTYGFPKYVWNHQKHPINLAKQFPGLINDAAKLVRAECPDGGVIFNAVNNWPVMTVAQADQDAVYIEVWPPHDTYYDLYTLIREAKIYSRKPVVLAAYLKAFRDQNRIAAEDSFRLAWAAISASGGTQLVLGEKCCLLQDSFYANYAKLRPDFLPLVQKYSDFLVRYSKLMYNDDGEDISKTASGGINEDVCFASASCEFTTSGRADAVWTILRQSSHRITVHLINLCGNNALWNEGKCKPTPITDIEAIFRIDRPIRGFYAASPDGETLSAQTLGFACKDTAEGRLYSAKIPLLEYWTVVWAEMEE